MEIIVIISSAIYGEQKDTFFCTFENRDVSTFNVHWLICVIFNKNLCVTTFHVFTNFEVDILIFVIGRIVITDDQTDRQTYLDRFGI